ncbi:hypothetical protein MACJ_001710 [Theileria orientalis]|uniref:Uncharacterized protein n=1 Tax=Theileria orientalis TaxID=68886 RepID=A0A976QWB9_THEOR|nr:hypothetical protein MACJ_001710 [Theileria orientalis]
MNTLIFVKGLILVALSAKFVRSDEAGESSTPATTGTGSAIADDISSIYESALPDFIVEGKAPITPSVDEDDIDISDSRDTTPIVPAAPIVPAKPAAPAKPIVPAIKKEDEDIFDRNHGTFPDGWHTYQGGNQLRGVEVPAKRKEHKEDAPVPTKTEEKKEKKEDKDEEKKDKKGKKTKAGEKKIRRDSTMPVGAIAVMVTSGCVLVVAIAVAITVRK